MSDPNAAQIEPGNKQLCRGVIISTSYIMSFLGLSKLAAMVFSMITFIIVAATKSSGDACYPSAAGYVEFVAMATFWSCLVMFVIFLFKLDEKITFIAWTWTELIWVSINIVLFFVAFLLSAIYTCHKTSLQVAAAFAFFSLVALGFNLVFSIKKFRGYLASHNRGQQPGDSKVSNADTLHDF